MRKNFAILFSFLIIQTLATKALASSWGTTIVCRGPNLTVRMTLPSSLPPNGGVNAGGTMTLSSGNQTSPMMKAAITMPDPASLGVKTVMPAWCTK